MSKELVVFANGVEVRSDKDEFISLTDLFKASGSPANKAVKDWIRLSSTESFIGAVGRMLKVDKSHLIKIKRGKGGGTYAHKQIALEYAQYADPNLAVAVNQVFFERLEEEKNPEKAIDRGISGYKKQGYSEEWISDRLTGKAARLSFCSTLSRHGVTNKGFGPCTNALYTPLYGGGSEVIREKKNLPAKANPRDHMSQMELSAIRFAENLAADTIERKNLKGDKPCEYACYSAAKQVADLITTNRKEAA